MSYNMEMDTKALYSIVVELDKKINELEGKYNKIRTTMKNVDGSNDNFKGEAQVVYYDFYNRVEKEFNPKIEQLKNYSAFLKKTIDNYKNRENDINTSVDNSSDDLSV